MLTDKEFVPGNFGDRDFSFQLNVNQGQLPMSHVYGVHGLSEQPNLDASNSNYGLDLGQSSELDFLHSNYGEFFQGYYSSQLHVPQDHYNPFLLSGDTESSVLGLMSNYQSLPNQIPESNTQHPEDFSSLLLRKLKSESQKNMTDSISIVYDYRRIDESHVFSTQTLQKYNQEKESEAVIRGRNKLLEDDPEYKQMMIDRYGELQDMDDTDSELQDMDDTLRKKEEEKKRRELEVVSRKNMTDSIYTIYDYRRIDESHVFSTQKASEYDPKEANADMRIKRRELCQQDVEYKGIIRDRYNELEKIDTAWRIKKRKEIKGRRRVGNYPT